MDTELEERLETPLRCRRECYEINKDGRTYCGIDKECIYKTKGLEGCLCMNLDKMV